MSPFCGSIALLKILLRSLKAPLSSASWRRLISHAHRNVGAAPPTRTILVKPIKRYVYHKLGTRGRSKLLKGHHLYFSRMFSDAVLFELYERHTVDVARLYARKSTQFVLELYSSEKTLNEREGELVLGIREPHSDYYLCRLTFLFAARGGGVALVIGGLQGPCGGHKRDVIAATRLLSGLRPKDAVLLAARSLARELGAETRAVATDALVFRNKRGGLKFADHDGYWRERGAVQESAQEFLFPALIAEDQPSVGRAEMKRAIVVGACAFVRSSLRLQSGSTVSGLHSPLPRSSRATKAIA